MNSLVGSRVLRSIMAKFSAIDDTVVEAMWGPAFSGANAPTLLAPEEFLRNQILEGSMPVRRAKNILNGLAGRTMWRARIEFIESIAALSAVYREDVVRKLPGTKRPRFKILWASTALDKAEWLFNKNCVSGRACQKLPKF